MSTTGVIVGLLTLLLFPGARDGATGADERLRAWEDHVELERISPFASLEWRLIGPRMAGGRIECVASPAGEGSTFYVGAGAGNLWKTTNHGTTWTPIFEEQSTFSIGDVAVAALNPDVVYVGTGEVLMARSSFAGTGVFRSDDAGTTWRHVGLADSHHIGRVLIDPRDVAVVWVAAIGHNFSPGGECGLYRTRNGGETWELSLSAGEGVGVVEVEMDPSDPDLLYAAAWPRSRRAWGHEAYGEASGLHRTTDGGETWRRLDGGLPRGDDVGRISVAVAPSNPAVVYALVTRRGRKGELWRSADRGERWNKVSEQKLSAGYDFCIVEVSPDDENELWVPLQKLWRSTDGGRTFQEVNGTVVHLLDHEARGLHLDTHCLWIDPSDAAHVVIGNDGGLYASWDRGETWLHVNNLPIAELYAVDVDMAEPYLVYGGTQDNAAVYGPSDCVPADGEPDPWRSVYLDPWGGGDSFFTPVDPLDPDVIFYEHQFGDLRRKNMRTGETAWAMPHDEEGKPLYRRNWMTPFLFSLHEPKTMYYGAECVLKSTDRGDSWIPISPDLSTIPGPERQGNVPFGTITTISESPLRAGMLWVGTDDGNVHVTENEGGTWWLEDEGLPEKWVTRVVASRHRERTAYVSLSGYVEDDFAAYLFRTDDQGATWTSIVGNLPAESVNVIREDPTDERILYVGTDLGAYVSLDRGESWCSLCATLPTTPVRDLVVHPRDPELVIGTHGRSAWVLDVEPIRRAAADRE